MTQNTLAAPREMGTTARLITVAVAVFVLAMLAVPWLLPSRAGDLGLTLVNDNGTSWNVLPGDTYTIATVIPKGAADRAGLRGGDVLQLPTSQLVAFTHPVAGVPFDVTLANGAHSRMQPLTPDQTPWPQRRHSLFIVAIFVVYVGLALLVAWKASRAREAILILIFLSALALQQAMFVLVALAPTSLLSLTADYSAQIFIAAILFIQFFFPLTFPARRTRAQYLLRIVGLPMAILSCAAYLSPFVDSWNVATILFFIFHPLVIAVVIESIVSAPAEYRAQAIAAGSTLALLALVNITDEAFSYLGGSSAAFDTSFGWLRYLAGIGMTYAVLRHRLVDLHLVISRAAIFSVVSLSLICLFLVVEWALALVLGHAIGDRFGPQSQTVLAVLIALGVGVSARSIHNVVEHRLNRIFFARRYRALADLHRFALETDVATDPDALLNLTLTVLERGIDAQYVAMYIGTPDAGYSAIKDGVDVGPPRIDPNDGLVLRLKRWGEAFVDDAAGDIFAGALICPMTLRGTLYGFVVCGRKADRTSYLPDERETLVSLTHRVGIAYEWLTRASGPSRRLDAMRD